jgi:hypothetical protein
VLRPHPLLNNLEGGLVESSSIFLQDPECSICAEPFPFADLMFCSCTHVYHPWCAAEWFKENYVCAVANCGTVHPSWYKSWGFGDYDVLAKKATELHHCSHLLPARSTMEGTHRLWYGKLSYLNTSSLFSIIYDHNLSLQF